MTQTTEPMKQPNRFTRWWSNWTTPRSADRDEAFREQTLRVTVAILLIATALSFLTSLPIFGNVFNLISYETLTFLMLLTSFYSAYLITKEKITEAGWSLVITLMIGSAGVTIMEGYWGILPMPSYMFTVLLAALVLPLKALNRVGVANTLLFIIIAIIQDNTDLKNYVSDFAATVPISEFVIYITNIIFLVLVETLLLRQIKVEFDNRLASMQQSIVVADEARAEAVDANQAKSRFFANMTHELRTPLNAIIGYAELMLNGIGGEFSDTQLRFPRHIHSNGRRLLSLVNDVLDLARIESGRLEFKMEMIESKKLVEDVVHSMQSLAERKGIELGYTLAENAPPRVYCDANKTQQIIINLVGNALKFTEEGSVNIKLGMKGQYNWTLEIKDTGLGIPKENLENIFEMFEQVEGTEHTHEGTGLGLNISRELVTRMGGMITVDSEIGKGSTFTVIFPHIVLDDDSKSAVDTAKPTSANVANGADKSAKESADVVNKPPTQSVAGDQ